MPPGDRRARVTVLLPVYNGAPFLHDALESVLQQTWADVALLIVDDGSTDESATIADAYARRDRRASVLHVPHRGVAAALNLGLDTIQTEFIARADADDVNHPERLARQAGFLDTHPDIGVVGTAVERLPDGGVWSLPHHWDALAPTLLFGVPMYHPTVMMRRDWIARSGCRYDPAFEPAEDYDFWERAAHVTRFANLQLPLVGYRGHPSQQSEVHMRIQAAHSRTIRERVLRGLGLCPTPTEIELHEAVVSRACATAPARLEAGRRWLERLRDTNTASGRYAEPAFTQVLATHWYRNCVASVLRGGAASTFTRSPLAAALPDARRRALQLQMLRILPPSVSHRVARIVGRARASISRCVA